MRIYRSATVAALTAGLAIATASVQLPAQAIDIPDDCDVVGTEFDDVIEGSSRPEVICALGGNDLIHAGSQAAQGDLADVVYGGDGDDAIVIDGDATVYGGPGDDTIECARVMTRRITCIFDGGAGDDRLRADPRAGGWLLGGDGDDTLIGVVVDGGPGKDLLRGTRRRDFLFGGPGDDTIRGGSDADHIVGGPGEDLLFGDEGWDTIRGGRGADTIDGGAGNDRLSGDEGPDTILGRAGADKLNAGGGRDILRGGRGADVLRGGAAQDVMWAGPDRDQLVAADGQRDRLDGGGEIDTGRWDPGIDQVRSVEVRR